MARRRLTDQQHRRIAAQHDGRRAAAQQADAPHPEDALLGPELNGRVIARFGAHAEVEDAEGLRHRCHLRATLAAIVTGDRVVMRLPTDNTAGQHGVVVALHARDSLLTRPDARGVFRPVAANIDRLLITIAPKPAPFANLIDRYLVAASHAGISPLLICNKADLLADDTHTLLAMYRHIGYPVHVLSCISGEGLATLRQALAGHTAAIVGQSGVGKSSLVHALLPDVDIAIGALSEAEDKGRHTTTTARLYHLPEGGALIDSPGIREFGLPNIPPSALLPHFPDLHTHAAHCRFRDCQHDREPGCAVQHAVTDGQVYPERLASYHALRNSLPDTHNPRHHKN